MSQNQSRARDARVAGERERRYQVWIGGNLTGTVAASDPQHARAYAASLYMVALRDVSVLPPY